MRFLDFLVLLPVGVWLIYSLRHMRRMKKNGGGCCGDCSRCGGCSHR